MEISPTTINGKFRWKLFVTQFFSCLLVALPLGRSNDSVAQFGRVELLRDAWGVPHVFAQTDEGAMYGLGQAVAEDRGFQITYNLRSIQGRMAEVLGDRPNADSSQTTVGHDRRMRSFGYYRAAKAVAERLDARTQQLLAAYCQGINDWFANHPDQLHPLFAKLGVKHEPWSGADCIASLWHLGQFFAGDGLHELESYREMLRGVPTIPPNIVVDDEAAIVQRNDVSADWIEKVRQYHSKNGFLARADGTGPDGPKFSHAWVAGRQVTTTGKSVLVSDPQTPVLNPSLFYEFHVCGSSFNARGVSPPGSPGLMIGWTENFAWGVTALGADQADLFRLRTDVEHPDQYWLDGGWKSMEVMHEKILVKDGSPIEHVVRQTQFGPVVSELADKQPGDPEVALRRIPMYLTDRETIQGLFGMIQATNVDEFTKALANWHFPSTNLVFGDRHGNIGYWLQAAVPARSKWDEHSGRVAVDGSESKFDWQGIVPHDLLPHVVNPSRGWIASGNHRAIESFYPISFGSGKGSTGHTLRSLRLYERLSAHEKFQPIDVLDMHFDSTNPACRDFLRFGVHIRDSLKMPLSADALSTIKHLESWFAAGSKLDLTNAGGAALASQIPTEFRAHSTPLANRFGGGNAGLALFLSDVKKRLSTDGSAMLSADEIAYVDKSLAAGWQSAQKRYGPEVATWNEQARTAARQTRAYMNHLNNFGSLELNGDLKTPLLTCIDGSTIKSQLSQAYTQYVPFDDLDSAQSILPPGNSERIGSHWHTSTMQLWERGELHPAPISRTAIQRIATSEKVLID